jgi:hypothetical protein
LGRFPEEAVRRAPQRSDWSPQQWRALERLNRALAGERLDEKTVFWRRKWVESGRVGFAHQSSVPTMPQGQIFGEAVVGIAHSAWIRRPSGLGCGVVAGRAVGDECQERRGQVNFNSATRGR